MEIFIDPRFNIHYSSYYIYGLLKVFGKQNIKFKQIEDIYIHDFDDFMKGFAFTISYSLECYRIFIDTNDSNTINEEYYIWADIYAKVNVNPADLDNHKKMLPVGPSFGIQLWNPVKTVYKALINYAKCNWNGSYRVNFKDYLLKYVYTFHRRSYYYDYDCDCSDENPAYIFSLNTLWYDKDTYSTTNKFRGVYAKQCKKTFSLFEGGFFYIPSPYVIEQFPKYEEYLNEYSDMLITKRISMKSYNEKIKKSYFVFNTPSVQGCHGWKLGEYLAMGKAIISTPLKNLMPGIFESGTHYIEVASEGDIRNAIVYLKENTDIVREIRNNSKNYFNEFLSPEAVIKRIVGKLRE